MYQLRNVLNRTAVPRDPANNMKATEDFMTVVLFAHLVVAAKSMPISHNVSLLDIATNIVDKFVHLTLSNSGEADNVSETDIEGSESKGDDDMSEVEESVNRADVDGVFNYACEVVNLGLLWHCYHDAIREGDGDRVMLIWKFLLLVFKAFRRKNYSLEAAILLLQNQYFLSPRKAAQLRWSRFVNTRGRGGCNIPCDLHMEHLNRRLKEMLRHLGSNIQPHSIKQAGKSLGVIHNICSLFEKESNVTQDTGQHKTPSFQKDLHLIVSTLEEALVFQHSSGRHHDSFNINQPWLKGVNKDKILDWLVENVSPRLLF